MFRFPSRRLAACAAIVGGLACRAPQRDEAPPTPPPVSVPTPSAPTPAPRRPATRPPTLPLATPAPTPRPLSTPIPAPTLDPARVSALVADGEGALAGGRLAEAAERFSAALALDPGDARARRGNARVATTRLGLMRTFVPELPSSEGAEGKVKALEGFDVDEGMDVRRAVKVPARAELEGSPVRLKPGDSYTVRIYLRNQDAKKKRKVRIVNLSVHRIVNGRDSSVAVAWKPLEVKPRERALVGSLSDRWEDDVTSWLLVVRVIADGGDFYENRLVWK